MVALFCALALAGLLAERWRGQWALNRWKAQMTAQGERLSPEQIWPRPTKQALVFSNQFQQANGQLPPRLREYSGYLSAMVMSKPGVARRGSQEPEPAFDYPRSLTNATWADLEALIRQARPALQSMESLLRHPPLDKGYAMDSKRDGLAIPNYVNSRVAAQALQAAAISDLHRGDLAPAKDELVALGAFSRLHADDPTLVSFMIRIAVVGLTIPVAWDAVQAEGWTDAQLAELQGALQSEALLAQMPRTMEAERAVRLCEMDWFASHSYLAWVERYRELYQSFGQPLAASSRAKAIRHYRQWVSHPFWCFAWADQEALDYLQSRQAELELLRRALKTGSYKELKKELERFHAAYRSSLGEWRFYRRLPFADTMAEVIGGTAGRREYPYANFDRAWSVTMKNLTLSQMLTTAIAVKRYWLRHGGPPPGLNALVPEFLDKAPRDLMDGEPLRYWVNSDGTFCLYSIGEDGQDDQANPNPGRVDANAKVLAAWDGADLVWPQLARGSPPVPQLTPVTISSRAAKALMRAPY